jgi:hypothetical protein
MYEEVDRLADKLLKNKVSRKKAKQNLIDAGIINKKGRLRFPYNLIFKKYE